MLGAEQQPCLCFLGMVRVLPEDKSSCVGGNYPCCPKHSPVRAQARIWIRTRPCVLRGWPGTGGVAHYRSQGQKLRVGCGNMKGHEHTEKVTRGTENERQQWLCQSSLGCRVLECPQNPHASCGTALPSLSPSLSRHTAFLYSHCNEHASFKCKQTLSHELDTNVTLFFF